MKMYLLVLPLKLLLPLKLKIEGAAYSMGVPQEVMVKPLAVTFALFKYKPLAQLPLMVWLVMVIGFGYKI
jgi:hypothetical protein